MKKNLLLAGTFALLAGTTALAQTPVAIDRKWDGGIEQLVRNLPWQDLATAGLKSTADSETLTSVIIQATDAAKVAGLLSEKGYSHTLITDEALTATIPVSFIASLAELPEVTFIQAPRTFKPLLNNSRKCSKVDDIHNGTGLETPFTGKGVIIGVIDQGFEYKHAAFLDQEGKTRVRALWNRYANSSATTDIPAGGDGIDAEGHGSHVACIAAGSKVEGNDFYGMAPEAEIIMIPSKFIENEVLEDAKYISDFAKNEGKPFVINMSFGSQVGAHDGKSTYCQSMSRLCGPGALMVAAMGNEGEQRIHASYTFKEDGEVQRLLLTIPDDNSKKFNYISLWGTATNGRKHLTVKPFVYVNKTIDYKTTSFWQTNATSDAHIDPTNRKECYTYNVNLTQLATATGSSKAQFGLEISGKAGDGFHAWINAPYGEFTQPILSTGFLKGDWNYCVGEGAGTIPAAISVGSYNSATTYKAVNGSTYAYPSIKNAGEISNFSSRGPFLGDDLKPTVVAPGAVILSAVSKYTPGFDREDGSLASIVQSGLQKYYYAPMTGTSMASPAVAGILALWLQANPTLTPEQVKEILRTTSQKDMYTGQEEWNATYGYGKINAYDGLKEALRLANTDGVNQMLNSEAPVTLSKGLNEWKVLFNNDESYADILLYTANGTLAAHEHLANVRRGDEKTLNVGSLTPGVYLIRINTTASTMTRKVLVK